MVLLAYPDAEIGKLWHVTLLMMLWLILMVGFNIFLAQHLPLAEGIVLVLHVFAFFAFVLWALTTQPDTLLALLITPAAAALTGPSWC